MKTAYLASCLQLKDELNRANVEHEWLLGSNESLVTRARNEMTATFLKTEHNHMMWIDADIEFTPEHVGKLWNMDADIAVGVYAMKKPDKQWYAAWKDGELVFDLDRFSSPVEVDYAGTGFMLIARSVVESLAADAEVYVGPDGPVPAVYMTPIHEQGFESEDYHFCRKAREKGFSILMDPTVRLKHWGEYPYGA